MSGFAGAGSAAQDELQEAVYNVFTTFCSFGAGQRGAAMMDSGENLPRFISLSFWRTRAPFWEINSPYINLRLPSVLLRHEACAKPLKTLKYS